MDKTVLMSELAKIHNLLYQTQFSREQVLVVADCIHIIRALLEQLNQECSADTDQYAKED